MPFIGKSPGGGRNNNFLLDAITTSATATYNLTRDSAAFTPVGATSLLVSLNGIIQAPISGYVVSGTQITFASALTSADVINYIIAFDGLSVTIAVADGAINLVKMAANSVDSDQYVDGSIDLVHMSVNSVDSDQYVDGSIDLVHMSANSVDSDQYVDGSIDLAHMSSESVDEDNLYISNSGTNGQVLSKQSGDTGGLTWATVGGAYSDWTILTTTPTTLAVKGQYICNDTTARTHTLPAGSAGDTIIVCNAGTGLVTLARTSSQKINSVDADGTLPQGNSVQLVYVDGTIGWFAI